MMADPRKLVLPRLPQLHVASAMALRRVEQFAALGLLARDGRPIDGEVALLRGGQEALGHQPVHERSHRAVSPACLGVKRLLDVGGGAGFLIPEGLHDRPFGLGQFDGGWQQNE